jgi:phosphoglycerate dehydrogenase-like enzyme
MKAFIFDPLWDELITDDLLGKLKASGIEPIVTKEIAPLSDCTALFEGDDERILCLNPDYVSWKLAADDYKNIPNLKAILGAATSFSWVDTSYADDKQIPVCNIRNFSTEAVAEWAITMLVNVARQTPRLIKDDFPLDFDKDFMKYRGVELHGKTVGIIGLGNIGSAIAKRCAGLGMKVTYWSKSPKESDYQHTELAELFANSDVIFPTMALNDETKNLITPELLGSMKPSTMFISVVHELFDEQLILNMVKNGKLFGFGYEASPSTFSTHVGNVWAAPAYAWVTDGSMANSMTKWVENMVDATNGKFPNKVNK